MNPLPFGKKWVRETSNIMVRRYAHLLVLMPATTATLLFSQQTFDGNNNLKHNWRNGTVRGLQQPRDHLSQAKDQR